MSNSSSNHLRHRNSSLLNSAVNMGSTAPSYAEKALSEVRWRLPRVRIWLTMYTASSARTLHFRCLHRWTMDFQRANFPCDRCVAFSHAGQFGLTRIVEPSTGQALGRVTSCDVADFKKAINDAYEAQSAYFAGTTAAARGAYLQRWNDLILANKHDRELLKATIRNGTLM